MGGSRAWRDRPDARAALRPADTRVARCAVSARSIGVAPPADAGESTSRCRRCVCVLVANSTVIDVSDTGLLAEGEMRLLPGTHVDVHLVTCDGRLLVRSRVIRAFVCRVCRNRIALSRRACLRSAGSHRRRRVSDARGDRRADRVLAGNPYPDSSRLRVGPSCRAVDLLRFFEQRTWHRPWICTRRPGTCWRGGCRCATRFVGYRAVSR